MVICGSTKLFYVIGDPIEQVKTPAAINPVFEAMGESIVCVPRQVTAKKLDEAWEGYRSTENLVGLGVTLPHKHRVAELCDQLDETAELTGVVNCVRREADGTMFGALFDGRGFVQGLICEGHDPRNHRVLMVGAGGAATAIAFALADAGIASITIANRTAQKAELLSQQVNSHAGTLIAASGTPDPTNHTLIINCTSLGLRTTDPLPVDANKLSRDMIVAEVVAKPDWTPLLKMAKQQQCSVHFGHHMIDHQVELIAQFVSSGG